MYTRKALHPPVAARTSDAWFLNRQSFELTLMLGRLEALLT